MGVYPSPFPYMYLFFYLPVPCSRSPSERHQSIGLDELQKEQVSDPCDLSKKLEDTKLFIYKNKAKVAALAAATIARYFKDYFLANVDDGDAKLAAKFGAHQSRHAVASALNDMGVPASDISKLTLNSPQTLQGTYIIKVARDWSVPQTCCDKQPSLSVKLLLPYIHFVSSSKSAENECACSEFVSFQPSVE